MNGNVIEMMIEMLIELLFALLSLVDMADCVNWNVEVLSGLSGIGIGVGMTSSAGDLLMSEYAGSRDVAIRRKVTPTDVRNNTKCPVTGQPLVEGSYKVSVLNLLSDGSQIKSGRALTRWVSLEAAISHGLIPAKIQGNRRNPPTVYLNLVDYPVQIPADLYSDYTTHGSVETTEEVVESEPLPTVEVAPLPTGDASGLGEVLGPHILPFLQNALVDAFNGKLSAHENSVMEAVTSRIAELTLPRETILSVVDEPDEVELGHTHHKFDALLRRCRTFIEKGKRMNTLMTGEAGSGKTFAAEQVFNALRGISEEAGGFGSHVTEDHFTVISCHNEMLPSDIVGVSIPGIGGEEGTFTYIPTKLVGLYESGGMGVLDEFDRLLAGTAVALNAAIAGSSWVLPDGRKIRRHKDFVCVATSNTFGNGRDGKYAGAQKLDAATLNRFAGGIIRWEYDPALEAVMCPDEALRVGITKYRQPMADARIARIISPRHLQAAYAAVTQHGLSHEEAIAEAFAEWSEKDLRAVGMTSSVVDAIIGGAA